MSSVGLSALVIARNEEAGIARCLSALGFCDEIVLIDAESTDRTVEIARRFTDHVWIEPWRGYSGQKSFALEKCRGDWVLWIDADEVVTPDLAGAIRAAIEHLPSPIGAGEGGVDGGGGGGVVDGVGVGGDGDGGVDVGVGLGLGGDGVEVDVDGDVDGDGVDGDADDVGGGGREVRAYEVARRVHYLGAWIRHSGWGEDRVIRLFRRGFARFSDDQVHERLLVEGEVSRLPGVLEHYTYRDLGHHWDKIRALAALAAEQAHSRGRRAGPPDLVFRPLARGFRLYVVKRGFLDGWRGWVIAGMGAAYVFLKYSMLREREERER